MAKTTYAPTMVANGKNRMKHNPLHGKYRRNPDDDFGGFGGSESAVAEKPAKAGKVGRPKLSASQKARNAAAKKAAAGTGGQRGRKPMTASQKAAAKAARAAAGPKPLSLASHITKLVHEAIKEAKVAAKTGVTAKKSGDPAKTAAQAAAHQAKKEAAKAKVQKLRDELKEAKSKLSVATKSHHIPSLKISVATPKFEKKPRAAAKEGAGKRGRKPMSASAKARAAEERAAKKGALVQNPKGSGTPRPSTAIGPYTMTLLKNPAMDFEVAGIKVVPAAAGAVGAVALNQFVRNLSFVADMKPSTWKTVIPSAVTVVLSALGYNYAKKNGHEFAAQVCSDVAAFGIAFGINDAVGQQITEMVDKLKKSPAGGTETKTNGSLGGSQRRFAAPQIHGSIIGKDLADQRLTGETSGYPMPNLQGSIQDNQGAQAALAQIHGSRIEQVNGSLIQSAGIDMSDFKEF